MPDDLLRHVIGPMTYPSWPLWLAIALSAILIGWYVGVFVLTSPRRRDVPLLGAARDLVIRHRFARAVHDIAGRYRSGRLDSAQAGAAISGELRRFLHRVSGAPAEYMQLDDIANSEISAAADVLGRLADVQFNASSLLDVGAVGDDVEELIRSWT